MASSGEGGSGGGGTGSAKAIVTDQICAAIKSTSNLLHLMQQSSPSQAQLMKLPKNLVAKASVTHNTGNVLKKLPQLVSSFDNHLDSGLQSVSHLKTVSQLLSNMENSQLKAISRVQQPSKSKYRELFVPDSPWDIRLEKILEDWHPKLKFIFPGNDV